MAEPSERPYKLAIAALGGQGGGVLTDWLIHTAEAERYLVQSTSVPGVAQRTGATIYYLEFFSLDTAVRAGADPVLALMPAAGDVDCVVAAELAESARAIQRGIVTPERTTLIASSHRVLTIGEKSAMGRGAVDEQALIELARAHAKRLILFDVAALADQHGSPVSAALLGAIAAADVLPFEKESFIGAVRASGIAVERNLAAFEAAFERVKSERPADLAAGTSGASLAPLPAQSRSKAAAPLLETIRARFPAQLQPLVLEGTRRVLDYQDLAYAALYLERLRAVLEIDGMQRDWQLTAAVARGLALWMSFEDTIRVADLKTRGARFERVRQEVTSRPGQIIGITEFLAPRLEEIAGTLPAALGRRVRGSPRWSRMLARFTQGRRVRSSTILGFLFLRSVASLRRFRRATLRFAEEDAQIRAWLARARELAPLNYPLAVEVARAQRLVKGYGDTHARGMRSFATLMAQLDELTARPDGAAVFASLHEAALADEEGAALAQRLQAAGLEATGPATRAVGGASTQAAGVAPVNI